MLLRRQGFGAGYFFVEPLLAASARRAIRRMQDDKKIPAQMDEHYFVVSLKFMPYIRQWCEFSPLASTDMLATDVGVEVESAHDFIMVDEIDHMMPPSDAGDTVATSRSWSFLSMQEEPATDRESVDSECSYSGHSIKTEPRQKKRTAAASSSSSGEFAQLRGKLKESRGR